MIDIIAIMNTNTSTMKLLVKKFLKGVSRTNLSISCLSFKSKISFSCLYWAIYSFIVRKVIIKELSNLLSLRNISMVYSEVVLLVKPKEAYIMAIEEMCTKLNPGKAEELRAETSRL